MLEKPSDIAWILGIAALVIVTFGFGVADVVNQGVTADQSFFTSINNTIEGSGGLSEAGANLTSSLDDSGAAAGTSEEAWYQFLLDAGRSLLQLGKVWGLVKSSTTSAFSSMGIDPLYVSIIVGVLSITFVVVLYTWIRGR